MKEKGSSVYQLFMLGLSIYVLISLVIESFYITDPEIDRVLQFIDLSICLVFLSDFILNFYYANNKVEYMKWGWIDLIASIPLLDQLRWGRLARIVRIFRFIRSVKFSKNLLSTLRTDKIGSLTLIVLFITFISYTLSAALILEYERNYSSEINTAAASLWWSFLNIMNAKVSLNQAQSPEGIVITIFLNKIGLLLFAYINSLIIAWLINKTNSDKEMRGVGHKSDE